MFTIAKMFNFDASHQLTGLPEGHKCMRLHGHSYRVELILRSPVLDKHSFVVDYGDLVPFEQYIKEHLDHQHLNDVLECPTTAEEIARHLYRVAWKLWTNCAITVRVSETPKTWASYNESGDA